MLLPILLFYHACYLLPRINFLHYYDGATDTRYIGDACNIQTLTDQTLFLLLLPIILGAAAALFGHLRRMTVCDAFHYKWRFPLSPHQTVAICAGYLFYLTVCLINRSFLLLSSAPLLAITSGPAVWGIWQTVHNWLLTYLSKPTWEGLIAETVPIWFRRRIGIAPDDILSIKASPDGLLEIHTRFTPEAAEQARLLGPMLPGISRVEIRDPEGAIIPPLTPQSRLSAALEAGRLVAELRRRRAGMFSEADYKARPIRIDDASVRRLRITAIVIAVIFATSLGWVALRGGYKRLTAEDLAWFFGRYGNQSSPRLRLPGIR